MKGTHATPEELEALVLGEQGSAAAAVLEEHARSCAECGRELAWQRAELQLIQKRAAAAEPLRPELWAAVEERVSASKVVRLEPRRPVARRAWLPAGAGLAAAAALVLSLAGRHSTKPVDGPAGQEDSEALPDADAAAALELAERDYRKAFSKLESDLQRAEKKDPAAVRAFRATMEKARARLDTASSAASGDVAERLSVLSGYATTLRSFQHAVDSEEARP